MKTMILSIALWCCVCILNAQEVNSTTLTGKWMVQKVEVFENGKRTETNEMDLENKCPTYVEFFSDGKTTNYNYKKDCTLRRKSDGTYTIKDGVLLVTEDGKEAINMTIITQKSDVMVLSAEEVYDSVTYKTVAYFVRYIKE